METAIQTDQTDVTTERAKIANTDGLLTDLENARRFANAHKQDVRYVSKTKQWLVWDGKRWKQDDTSEVQRRAKATVRALYSAAAAIGDRNQIGYAVAAQSAGRIAGMIQLAASEAPFPVTLDQLDRDPFLLNVENGTVGLHTGELREHRREDFITKLAPVVYEPDAACPTWEKFLGKIMAGNADLIRYVQKILGYALTGDAREQCFFILHGTGSNGKTTLTTAVAKMVGGYAQHTPTETLLVKRNDTIPNDVARLYGARLVTAAEAECNRKLAEALIKQVTGGDKMTARFLHKEFFEFTPTFKLFLAVNHKPVIQGTDHAIWRRVRLIPFDVTIHDSEQDKTLPAKLEAEKAGILRWAVEGCLAWQREGLEPPETVTKATADYRDEMDTVGAFIDECCTRDPDAEATAKRLYERYSQWCLDHEEKPVSQTDLGARLAEKGFTRGRTKAKGRFWRGLSVTG